MRPRVFAKFAPRSGLPTGRRREAASPGRAAAARPAREEWYAGLFGFPWLLRLLTDA